MSNLKILEHNATTGEVIERDLTAEEVAQNKLDVVNEQVRKAEEVARARAKVALLDKLGITADEAKLLLS